MQKISSQCTFEITTFVNELSVNLQVNPIISINNLDAAWRVLLWRTWILPSTNPSNTVYALYCKCPVEYELNRSSNFCVLHCRSKSRSVKDVTEYVVFIGRTQSLSFVNR